MTSSQLVKETMKGNNPGRTPVYGWLSTNLTEQLTNAFGSVESFEDKYEFDMAHIFGCPQFYGEELEMLRASAGELTPELLLDVPMKSIDNENDYAGVIAGLKHHKARDRFCYVQTDGIFEAMNGVFGIENHLLYMALYPDELKELYRRLADWNIKNAENLAALGVDDIHVSDDWGAQKNLMFSTDMFREMIYPNHRKMVESYKKLDVMTSLHSDGCITPALGFVADIGYDFIHPWQENCNMPYSICITTPAKWQTA